jgi:hypothetical protein
MDKVDMLLEPVRIVLSQIGAFLPRLAVAFAVLVAGWLLAKIIRFTVVKALRAVNFNVLTEHAGMDGFLRQGGIESDTTDIFGTLIYWLVIFATLVIAFNSLGLTYVTDLFGQVVTFVPKVIVALLILAFGSYFARFIYNTVVVVFVVLIALDQMNVGGDIIRQSFLVILAGVVFALALAFGIGGQRWAAGLLERWLPRPNKDDK